MALKCLLCRKDQTYRYDHRGSPVWVEDGVTFRAYGQWGSSVFGEINGSRLELIICDPCLKKRKKDLLYFGPTPIQHAEKWNIK